MSKLKFWLAGIATAAVVAGAIVAVNVPATVNSGPAITNQIHQDVSKPLRLIKETKNAPKDKEDEFGEKKEEAREESYPKFNKSLKVKADPVVQKLLAVKSSKPLAAAKPPTTSGFAGLGDGTNGFTVNSAPPDTNMDVSATQIVEVVNSSLAIFNKTGTRLYGPVELNTLWSGFRGGCQNDNDGDPTVAYDRLANRWVISQFAVSHTSDGNQDPYLQCVAVSKTSDATGSYYRYSFGYTVFPDYPKLAVWPDAYYTTFNGFDVDGSGWTGSFICAYDRNSMLAGKSAKQACTADDPDYGGVLVATIDGSTAPTTGTSAYAMAMDTQTSMALWRLSTDFSRRSPTISKSSVSIVTVPYFQWTCPTHPDDNTCVPQAGTANVLDTLGDRLMNRFAYRKIGSQESFIVSHSADVSEITSTRWYEFRPSGSTLTVYQSNTYNPNAKHRWMPSVAMDRMGNIAMVYSVSSDSMNPSIAMAAHNYTADLGVIDTGEVTLKAGTGSQTGDLTRWGDYAAIAVDPSDDCTFWSATEYIAANGEFNWQTWISKYKLANCTAPAIEVSSITSSGAIGSTITITGTLLTGVNQVKIGGVGASNVKVVSATSVTAVVAPGTTGGQVWVSNANGQTALSSGSFTVTYPTTTATNIKPTSVKVGATITISGSNLDQVSAVTIGGVSQPKFTATASNLYAAVPTGVSAGNSKVVQLTTPNGNVNAASGITVTSGSTLPTGLRLSSSRGAIGSSVTITGLDLASASEVKFGATNAVFTVLNGQTILAAVPSASAGSAPVSVTTPGGTSTLVSFTIQTPASSPTISSAGVTPTTATVGNLISVTGKNLAGVTAITFNSVAVTRFTIVSGTQLTFYVPEGATTGSFTITTVGGSVTYYSTVTIY